MRLSFLLLALLLCACSPSYAVRASYEEARILWRREPIVEILKEPDLDAATREKLRLVLMVREFATKLGLDVGGSYRTYATISKDQTIYAVSAAPRFKLEPYTWWFPFVGRMPYKGFFSAADARDAARELQSEGYDTAVFPIAAFSTLGWFDDPLLSNLLQHDDIVLASIVLHELTHNTFYVPGESAFNESFANFVGGRGAIEFFADLDGESAPRTQQARALWHDDELYSAFLTQLTTRLDQEYAKGITLEERDTIFNEEQERLAAQSWQTDMYRGMAKVKFNNAIILQEWIYHYDFVVFDAAYSAEGENLQRTISSVIATVRGAADPFAALQARYQPAKSGASASEL